MGETIPQKRTGKVIELAIASLGATGKGPGDTKIAENVGKVWKRYCLLSQL